MPNAARKSLSGGRNPLSLSYDHLIFQTVDLSWVSDMCRKYSLPCAHPECNEIASDVLVTLYTCSFICLLHASRITGDEPLNKIQRIILTDLIDEDLYSDFRDRSLSRNELIVNGEVTRMSKEQIRALRKREEQEKELENKSRMAMLSGRDSKMSRPANVVHLADHGWPVVEYDDRHGIDGIIMPTSLVAKKKFAPEVNASNDTGITVEDLF